MKHYGLKFISLNIQTVRLHIFIHVFVFLMKMNTKLLLSPNFSLFLASLFSLRKPNTTSSCCLLVPMRNSFARGGRLMSCCGNFQACLVFDSSCLIAKAIKMFSAEHHGVAPRRSLSFTLF